jgi:hypothetical protein
VVVLGRAAWFSYAHSSYIDLEARVRRTHPLRKVQAIVNASSPSRTRFRADLCADRPVDPATAAATQSCRSMPQDTISRFPSSF